MQHTVVAEQRVRGAQMRGLAIHVVVALVGAAGYIAGGWLVLTHLLSNGDMKAAPPRSLGHGEGLTITVSVIDGPTLSCAIAPNTVASDTIEITAKELKEVIWGLVCWEPSGS
jgi:hypothetical protein